VIFYEQQYQSRWIYSGFFGFTKLILRPIVTSKFAFLVRRLKNCGDILMSFSDFNTTHTVGFLILTADFFSRTVEAMSYTLKLGYNVGEVSVNSNCQTVAVCWRKPGNHDVKVWSSLNPSTFIYYKLNALRKMDFSLLDVAVTKEHFCMFSVLTNRIHYRTYVIKHTSY
jgi:hypothetical protein